MAAWSLSARWVFPVAGPPLRDGVVAVDGGRIVAVEPAGIRKADVELGNVAVLPGLVNAHTHLDLTGMRGLAPPSRDFTGWLRKVISFRRHRNSEEVQADIHAGLSESIRAGVTLLGDISSEGASWEALSQASLRAVVYRELIGLNETSEATTLDETKRWLAEHANTPTCSAGISPHAPYSVRRSLFCWASRLDVPTAVHLAESREEMELLICRSGPFVAFLDELVDWDPDELVATPEEVLRYRPEEKPIAYVHVNYLDLSTRFGFGQTIVYCPRTHAAFGHPPHPFREFLARGVNVALGTDSLASNPDLDLLAEARFIAREFPDFPGDELLRMVTVSGAQALWTTEVGSLAPGKSADLVVLPLPDHDDPDPHRLIFESDLPVRAVLFRGKWVHDAAGMLAPPHGEPAA